MMAAELSNDARPPRAAGRRGCLALVGLWLCVAALSVMAGLLAARGELLFGRDPLRQTRVWLVEEQGNRGIGVSTARITRRDETQAEACVTTRVRFLLWRATEPPEAAEYCECYRREVGVWQFEGACVNME